MAGIRAGSIVTFGVLAWVQIAGASEGREIFDGISYFRVDPVARDVPQSIHVLKVDLTRPGVSFETTPGDSSRDLEYRAQTTSSYLIRNHVQAAVNGGYFRPWFGGSKGADDYYPHEGDPVVVSGLAMHARKVVSPAETNPADTVNYDLRVDSVLCIHDRVSMTIESGQRCPDGTEEAVSAGPRLLAAGKLQSFEGNDLKYANDRHPRTAIGLAADRKTAWMVVVDGRQKDLSMGASLQEMTQIFQRLGAADALNLDGGGSTTMVVADHDGARVLNSPIHTGVPGRERPSANHLGIHALPLRSASP